MFLRRIAALATAVVLASSVTFAAQAGAADATGSWTGNITFMKDGQVVDEDPVHMILTQKGSVLTGSAGPNAETQFEISNAKISTTKGVTTLTFTVDTKKGLVIDFSLALTKDQLSGSAKGQKDGDVQTAKAELKRNK